SSTIVNANSATTNTDCERRREADNEPRSDSFSTCCKSGRLARNAGHKPNNNPQPHATTSENVNTRQSNAGCNMVGNKPVSILVNKSIPNAASPNPKTPPTKASNRLSINNWRTMRPEPAPSALRIAISRARALPRANSKLETLAQAINSTSATVPNNIVSVGRASPVKSSWRAKMATLQSFLKGGYSAASCCLTARNSACAWAIVAPGATRPHTPHPP